MKRAATRTCQRVLAALAILAAGGLAGCRDDWRLDNETAVRLNQPEQRHPITFDERQEVLFIELPHMGASLSHRQERDVSEFLHRYRREGGGAIKLSTPHSARGHMAAQRSVAAIEEMAVQTGIEPASLRRGRHRAHPRYGETIQLVYRRPVAVAPICNDWSADVGQDRERIPYNDFGCATQRNLAKMVANSRDLMRPQPETPRSAERRSAHWSEYVSGTGGSGDSKSDSAKPQIK
ncbi:MAG: hypothetical protein RLZ98_570 [Pseudomonadota bacterium]|jgi:pilus assembly protein CpaD